MDEVGARSGPFVSEVAQCGGSLRWVPLFLTLEDMLRKFPDKDIYLPRDPFTSEGKLESGVGLLYWSFE